MTKQEILLAAEMLSLAEEKFSNHGCNDLDESATNLITNEKELCDSLRDWYGDPDGDWPTEIGFVGDSMLMSYLSVRLKEFAKLLPND